MTVTKQASGKPPPSSFPVEEETRAVGPTASDPLNIRKILVPVDFSECSFKAWKYALAFASQFDASLAACHVINITQYCLQDWNIDFANYLIYEEEIEQGVTEKLNDLIAGEPDSGITMEAVVRIGDTVPQILEVARELEVDFIIISTHGHTGLKHAFLGSTSENVVRRAPCPVLIVREQEHEFIET